MHYHITDLGTLGYGTFAMGINDRGQVTGHSAKRGDRDVFLWQNRAIHDLGAPGRGLCSARAISNKGVIVGYWWPEETGYKGSRALVWIGGKMADLNDLIPAGSGWVLENASDVNNNGAIVGCGKH
jgi:probable HAF family extracellular repeat protein